jgi:hypothetical protein
MDCTEFWPGVLAVEIDFEVQLVKSGDSSGSVIFIADSEPPLNCDDGAQVEGSLSLTLPVGDKDEDDDGCNDWAELGANEAQGGKREPFNPYDFYDVGGMAGGPPDGIVDLPNDILGVIQHFAPRAADARYDPAFDRGPPDGPYPWNMTEADGVIDLANDILGVIQQYLHDCR